MCTSPRSASSRQHTEKVSTHSSTATAREPGKTHQTTCQSMTRERSWPRRSRFRRLETGSGVISTSSRPMRRHGKKFAWSSWPSSAGHNLGHCRGVAPPAGATLRLESSRAYRANGLLNSQCCIGPHKRSDSPISSEALITRPRRPLPRTRPGSSAGCPPHRRAPRAARRSRAACRRACDTRPRRHHR